MIIVNKYRVCVYGKDGKCILTTTELATSIEKAEEALANYVLKSTINIYSKSVPLKIYATIEDDSNR